MPPDRIIRSLITLLGFVLFTQACASSRSYPTISDSPISRAEEEEAEVAYDRGLDLVMDGDYEAALAEFKRVIEEYPSSQVSGLALYWQGRSSYQLGDDAAAARALDQYLNLSSEVPHREAAVLVLSNSQYGLREYEAALATVLTVATTSGDQLSDYIDLASALMSHLPRTTVESTARREPPRNYLAPFYLQAARWSYASGDTLGGQNLAAKVAEEPGVPADMVREAQVLAGSGRNTSLTRPRLGFVSPEEGRFAEVGEEILRGVDLALEDINANRAAAVEIVSRATTDDPDRAVEIIRELARSERVEAVLGPLTSESALPAAETASEEGISLISPTATDARLLQFGPNVFTVNALDGAIGHTIGTYATSALGLRRLAILLVDDSYGRIQADAFETAVQEQGGRVIYRHQYDPSATDFTDPLGEITRAGAEAVFISTNRPNQALRVLSQIAFYELEDLLPLGTDAWNDDSFLAEGRELARGYFADTFTRDARVTRWEAFSGRYTARHGSEPANLIPAWGYDATRLALEEMGLAATTGTDRSYRGASALFRLTPRGPRRAVVVHRIDNGLPVAVDW